MIIFLCGILLVCLAIWVATGYAVGCDPFWFIGKPLYLKHWDGEITKTRTRMEGMAYLYASTKTGLLYLNSDGTTRGNGMSFITHWAWTIEELENKS